MKARVAGFLLILLILISDAVPASAHRVYEGWAVTFDNGQECLKVKSTIDHGVEGTGFWWGEVSAVKAANVGGLTIHCRDTWKQPSDWLRVKIIEWYYALSGQPYVCRSYAYYYNVNPTAYIDTYDQQTKTKPPCGNKDYWTVTRGGVLFNGAWQGNQPLESGVHYLPASPEPPPKGALLGVPSLTEEPDTESASPAGHGAPGPIPTDQYVRAGDADGNFVGYIPNPLLDGNEDVVWNPPGAGIPTVVARYAVGDGENTVWVVDPSYDPLKGGNAETIPYPPQ